MRADNNGTPFSNEKSIAAICEGEFAMGKKGAENLAILTGLNIEFYARAEQSGTGGGFQLRTAWEALFGAVMFLASFIVVEHTGLGSPALERSDQLGRHLENVAGKMRKFHAMHQRISMTPRVRQCFIQLFNKDLRAWADTIIEMAFIMKRDANTFPGPHGVRPRPLPAFEELLVFLDAVPA